MNNIRIIEMGLSIVRLIFQGSRDALKHTRAKEMAKKERKNRRREEDDKFYHRLIERAVDANIKRNSGCNPIDKEKNENTPDLSKGHVSEKIELIPASYIPDRDVPSVLLGHCGNIIIINGEAATGKSILAISLTAEACLGQSSNLIPDTEDATGPMYTGIYYHAERDNKFNTKYVNILSKVPNLKAAYDMKAYEDFEEALEKIEENIMEVKDNVVVCIDNITSLVPSLMTNHKVTDFINGLKRIRKKMEQQGFVVTFIIVTHGNSQGQAIGSKDWFNLADGAFINVIADSKSKNKNDRIIECTKRKGLRPFSIDVEITDIPYVHFIPRTSSNSTSAPAQPVTPAATIAPTNPTPALQNRKPITLEVAAMLYMEKKNNMSLSQIFSKYNSAYELQDRYTVQYKINTIPSKLLKIISIEDMLDIWLMGETYGKTPKEIIAEVGDKYNIHDENIIQYIIDEAPAMSHHSN